MRFRRAAGLVGAADSTAVSIAGKLPFVNTPGSSSDDCGGLVRAAAFSQSITEAIVSGVAVFLSGAEIMIVLAESVREVRGRAGPFLVQNSGLSWITQSERIVLTVPAAIAILGLQPVDHAWLGAINPDCTIMMNIPLLAGRVFTSADGESPLA